MSTRTPISQALALIGVAPALLALAACTSTVTSGIGEDGKTSQELVWPKLNDTSERAATLPSKQQLQQLRPGLRKQDLYQLVGVPHFSEMLGAREWDYLYRTDGEKLGAPYCRLKVIFDRDYVARSLYWLPEGCGNT